MKKSINSILIVILIFANIYIASINITNSKYVSESYITGNVKVANWNVELEYNDSPVTNTYSINLNETTSNKKIVPGSSGSFSITVNAKNCTAQIPIQYEIKLENASNLPENMHFTITKDEETDIKGSSYTESMTGGLFIKEKEAHMRKKSIIFVVFILSFIGLLTININKTYSKFTATASAELSLDFIAEPTYTYYFQLPPDWTGDVWSYMWDDNSKVGDDAQIKNAIFPGETMKKVDAGKNIYS